MDRLSKILCYFFAAWLTFVPVLSLAATNRITGRQIAVDTVTDNNLANGSVGSLEIQDNSVRPADLLNVGTLTDEFCLTYESTGAAIQFQDCWATMQAAVLDLQRTTVADTNATLTNAMTIIAYTSLTATRTVTLPTAATATSGHVYYIKDESGNASGAVKITVDGSGSERIDGQLTASITAPYGILSIYSNGSNWFTMN